MSKIRERGSASVAYRVDADTLQQFKKLMPKHIRITYVYETLFEVIMEDEDFQDEIAKRSETYIVPGNAKFACLSLTTLPAAKRLKINKALWRILKGKITKYRRSEDVGMAGIVTIAVGLIADGTFDLPLS